MADGSAGSHRFPSLPLNPARPPPGPCTPACRTSGPPQALSRSIPKFPGQFLPGVAQYYPRIPGAHSRSNLVPRSSSPGLKVSLLFPSDSPSGFLPTLPLPASQPLPRVRYPRDQQPCTYWPSLALLPGFPCLTQSPQLIPYFQVSQTRPLPTVSPVLSLPGSSKATPFHRGDGGDRDSDPEWGCLPELSPSRASVKAAGPWARARAASRGRNSGAMLRLVEILEEERQG